MFKAYPPHPENTGALHEQATWIDLIDPTPDEVRMVEGLTGLHVPQLDELSEIETSSRLQRRAEVLYMSMPALRPRDDSGIHMTPIGFVLSRDRLITVRFAALPAFEQLGETCQGTPAGPGSSVDVLLGLLEGVVDRIADVLEHEGEAIDHISHKIFRPAHGTGSGRLDRELRGTLGRVGGLGDLNGKVRDTLLGIARIEHYAVLNAADWFGHEQRLRFKTLRSDVLSLNEYGSQLFSKIQFLLDATVGLIGIEQNNKFSVLTIVSIVGIPPTFVASMYGMNFEHIPELHWAWGYQYALILMLISAVAPLVWFRLKGWV